MSSMLLCVAAKAADVQKVSILTDASAMLTVTDKRGFSPLMAACENITTVACGRILIQNGANVNFAATDSGLTALHVASKEGHVRMVALLLHKGADPLAKDIAGRTPLHWACVGTSKTIVRLLLKATKTTLVDQQDLSGYTPLMTAAEFNRTDIVKILLAGGARAQCTNKLTHTATELADWYGHKAVLAALSTQDTKASSA